MTSPRYILVAEDDVDATFLLQHAFTQVARDVRVVYTSDGKEAIDVLEGSHSTQPEHHPLPLLLLLDWNMPRMNGFEVLDWLQRSPALRPDCIVVLGTSSLPADMKRDTGAWRRLLRRKAHGHSRPGRYCPRSGRLLPDRPVASPLGPKAPPSLSPAVPVNRCPLSAAQPSRPLAPRDPHLAFALHKKGAAQ